MEPRKFMGNEQKLRYVAKRDGGGGYCPSIIMSAYMWRKVNRQNEKSHTEERFISRSKLIGQSNM